MSLPQPDRRAPAEEIRSTYLDRRPSMMGGRGCGCVIFSGDTHHDDHGRAMLETLFGAEMPLAMRFLISWLIVVGLVGVTASILRRSKPNDWGARSNDG